MRLLAPEHTRVLADIANWADEIRNDPTQQALWKQTRRLHYINFSDGQCRFAAARDCAGAQCVVGGIDKFVAILANHDGSDAQRRQALKFVAHLVGDVHQPLHGGSRNDGGGSDWQVQWEGKGSNLHRVWDSGLLHIRRLDAPRYADRLALEPRLALPPPMAPLNNPVAQWAEESCHATLAPGFYPTVHLLDRHYVDAERPLAERRLREAGERLAQVLNVALSSSTIVRSIR